MGSKVWARQVFSLVPACDIYAEKITSLASRITGTTTTAGVDRDTPTWISLAEPIDLAGRPRKRSCPPTWFGSALTTPSSQPARPAPSPCTRPCAAGAVLAVCGGWPSFGPVGACCRRVRAGGRERETRTDGVFLNKQINHTLWWDHLMNEVSDLLLGLLEITFPS